MTVKDLLDLTLSGADAAGAAQYEKALHELQCFIGDPVGSVDAALAENPDFVMAHVLKGYLYGLSTDHEATAVVKASHAAASGLPATERERGHVAALGHLAEGRWHEAGRVLEDVTIDEPRDALALLAGHQIDFFTGNSRMLRDRISRAMPSWAPGMQGYHATLAMQAFGFEEMGDYARAEALGRHAIGIEPRDGWAQHAVAHVMEMQCRQRDGISWMRDNTEAWTKDSFFQVHNWWHLALFHYELGEIDQALALFDAPIYGVHSTLALNMLDASALLWRLHLARRRCRRPLDSPCGQLGAQGQGRQLRLQRRACHDGLRRSRARRARAAASRSAAAGDGRRRRQCRLHPRCRLSGHAGDQGFRRRGLCRGRDAAQA